MTSTFRECRGDQLTREDQQAVKSMFVNRYTVENIPRWAKATRVDGSNYPVQFANDADWLRNTYFRVTKSGRLHGNMRYCRSNPTWPFNPELRRGHAATLNF